MIDKQIFRLLHRWKSQNCIMLKIKSTIAITNNILNLVPVRYFQNLTLTTKHVKYFIQKFYSQIFRPYGVFWPNKRRSRNLPAKIKNKTTTAASKTKFCEKTSSTPPSKSYQIWWIYNAEGDYLLLIFIFELFPFRTKHI